MSRGTTPGLIFTTDRATIARAILEGLAFELPINFDLLHQSGVAIETLHVVGGCASNPL